MILFRGLPAVFYRYQEGTTVYTVFSVENSNSYVELTLATPAGSEDAYPALLHTAYTLDLAL